MGPKLMTHAQAIIFCETRGYIVVEILPDMIKYLDRSLNIVYIPVQEEEVED